MDPTTFVRILRQRGIRLNPSQVRQFAFYYRELVRVNRNVNLTSITSKASVYLKHFYDSLTPAMYVESLRHHHLSICDVGAGAGFPSLPLKIAFPNLRITLIDSLNKRVRFLRSLVKELGLDQVKILHVRAEDFGKRGSTGRERYDMVIARAVAKLNVLTEFCLPLVKIGGEFVAMKATQADQELERAQTAIKVLGGRVVYEPSFKLPQSDELRRLIIIRKQKRTPLKYPRRAGVPNRKPI